VVQGSVAAVEVGVPPSVMGVAADPSSGFLSSSYYEVRVTLTPTFQP